MTACTQTCAAETWLRTLPCGNGKDICKIRVVCLNDRSTPSIADQRRSAHLLNRAATETYIKRVLE